MSDYFVDDPLARYTTEPDWVRRVDHEEEQRTLVMKTDTYEGQIVSHVTRVGQKDPFQGVHLARLHVELFNVDGQATKMYFQDVCPTEVLRSDGKQTTESKLWTSLAKVTGTMGKPAPDTLAAAKLLRLKFRIRYSPEVLAEDGVTVKYKARNWTDAIAAIR